MVTCGLVGAVDFNADHFAAQEFDSIIAVDKGFAHLRDAGIIPDTVIGDFDSLGFVPEHPHVMRFDTHKDASDIELAMDYAARNDSDTLVVYGCLSGRLDHTYGVLQLFVKHALAGRKVFGIGDSFAVVALSGGACDTICFEEGAAGTVSVFAAGDAAYGVCERGVEYPLEDAAMYNTTPYGVSNEFNGAAARISVREGSVLVFFPIGLWDTQQVCRSSSDQTRV